MGKRKAVVDAAARGVDEADGVDDLGLPPLAPVHATLGGTSSSDATVPVATDPSLYDAMAMEEVINADASEAVAEVVVAEEEGTHVSSVTTADPPKRKVFKRERELNGVLRTYKIRMLPTPEQRQELKLAFSMARKAYNWAVDAVNNKRVPCNFQQLRNAFEKDPLPKWATGEGGKRLVHNKITARAIKQAYDAFSTNFKKKKKNPSHTFQVRFRSIKKNYTETLVLERIGTSGPLLGYEPAVSTHRDGREECLVRLGGNLSRSGAIRLQDKQRVIDRMVEEENKPKEDAKILWDKRTHTYHFIYTFDAVAWEDEDPEFKEKRVVAGDPGERDFMRWGSPTDGKHGEMIVGFREEIFRRCKTIDSIKSRIDRRGLKDRPRPHRHQRTARQRYETTRQLRRKLARERRRLHNWVEGAHYDAANFLLRRYDVLILPKLSTGQMVQKDSRVFGSKVARSMCTMSHGLFSQRVESAASRYRGRHVITDSGEPGTSKTCSNCGYFDTSLGDSKVYNCPRCGICMDRDVNGWRGNLFAAYGKAVGVGWDGRGN